VPGAQAEDSAADQETADADPAAANQLKTESHSEVGFTTLLLFSPRLLTDLVQTNAAAFPPAAAA
jgi:cytochrome b561